LRELNGHVINVMLIFYNCSLCYGDVGAACMFHRVIMIIMRQIIRRRPTF